MKFLFLIIPLFLISSSSTTKFVFEGELFCYKPDFSYSVQIVEKTQPSKTIISESKGTSKTHDKHFEIEGIAETNGTDTPHHDIDIDVIHNCYPDGHFNTISHHVGEFHIEAEVIKQFIKFDLNDKMYPEVEEPKK
ncbi:Protein CBG27465 [Caenorhabditis briggsae]|uniref:Uncharacterized protein n=2 Tax=Caenorhabditis briggsae TaxID=6238 RepID=A0AAE8ZU97_CAEBR|nr:Protein CBG27465 [Caenorhabditis briggsae]ULT80241.1 hypothetical protein L3Y34_010665 [Caenorhabditis briggsae]UMM39537.1 hypothetical protein L5515_016554 [Caenorhabditis briggsae]CAS00272.1 Protein CBG27465 [Caenorhabditis briggsae]